MLPPASAPREFASDVHVSVFLSAAALDAAAFLWRVRGVISITLEGDNRHAEAGPASGKLLVEIPYYQYFRRGLLAEKSQMRQN
jgi:hypothetical protein